MFLYDIYNRDMRKLLEKEMPLEDEIKLFTKIYEIKERLVAAKKANSIHGKMSSTYEEVKKLNINIDKINESIKGLADSSPNCAM